jgi:hypothetical protein
MVRGRILLSDHVSMLTRDDRCLIYRLHAKSGRLWTASRFLDDINLIWAARGVC